MRIFYLVFLLAILTACYNAEDNKIIPNKSSRESIENEIIGIWELIKENYRPTEEPSLINRGYNQYLEIKSDGTCQDDRDQAIWFLSYTNDYVIDSTSKVLFTEISDLKAGMWMEYDRKINVYQINVTTENGTKFLYLTSLKTLGTRIYVRKI